MGSEKWVLYLSWGVVADTKNYHLAVDMGMDMWKKAGMAVKKLLYNEIIKSRTCYELSKTFFQDDSAPVYYQEH